tara:strand:- start:1097 stop:2056 length:960 start_codon:yes stop_codon:yes gene_type:complete
MTSSINKSLSIVIPTYNRPSQLEKCLDLLLDKCCLLNINIFISDDSSNDEVFKLIHSIKKRYSIIHYSKNESRLGHDLNFFHSLEIPKSDYVWVLSDAILVDAPSIEIILNIIKNNKYEIISINAKNRDLKCPSGSFSDSHIIIEKFGWHLNLMGAAIYSKNVINTLKDIDVTNCKNFPHFYLIFTYLSINPSFYWLNKKILSSSRKKSYWMKNIFTVWFNDWPNVVHSLSPRYNKIDLNKIIVNHSIKTKMFNPKSLVMLRLNKFFNYKKYKKYKSGLVNHSSYSKYIILLISIVPSGLIKIIYNSLRCRTKDVKKIS